MQQSWNQRLPVEVEEFNSLHPYGLRRA